MASVRKLAQFTAFLIPSALLIGACTDVVASNSNFVVASITLSLGVSSFSLAGLYCTHQDLSPKYAAPLLGLTNTAGAIPGIAGVTTVGFLYDQTQSWELCLFLPSAILMISGAFVYVVFGENDFVDFDAPNANAPFKWEVKLKELLGGEGEALCMLNFHDDEEEEEEDERCASSTSHKEGEEEEPCVMNFP
eukprot:gene6488-3124_t